MDFFDMAQKLQIIYQSKILLISCGGLELINGTIAKIKAYDDFADFCYRRLKRGKNIIGYGKINNNIEVEAMCLNITSYAVQNFF